MRNDSESIDQSPPRPSLTPKEQATLLADLDAAYAVEYSQPEHTSGVATQPMTDPAALTAEHSASTVGQGRADSPD